MTSAIVLFAHGARDPEWAAPFRRLQSRLRETAPGRAVELAFLEFMSPALPDALDTLANAGHHSILLVPLFMAPGGHLKRDVPQLLDAARQRHPGLVIDVAPTVGESEAVTAAIAGWIETLAH